jgi:hypothetical protein
VTAVPTPPVLLRYAARLPWAPVFGRRCRARLHRADSDGTGFWGRCELRARHKGRHALERGMVVLRWGVVVDLEGADCHPVYEEPA